MEKKEEWMENDGPPIFSWRYMKRELNYQGKKKNRSAGDLCLRPQLKKARGRKKNGGERRE